MLTEAISSHPVPDLAQDVVAGLSKPGQKELPSKYLYDDVGSALFEVICLLPEYGVTRADERVLRAHAEAIVERIPSPVVAAELGSGSGKKTRWILEALARRSHTAYYSIEISAAALAMCQRELGQVESVSIVGLEREYLDGLLEVAARRADGHHLLVLFLGSTIGNFDRVAAIEFLRQVRRTLLPGDSLLMGTDLEKPVPQLELAYADPLGVTAAFNLNLLVRLNRELDADFDLNRFEHVVRYDARQRRIEMHLRSRVRQTVTIPKAAFQVTFQSGETIWTESSQKFGSQEVTEIAKQTGFRCLDQWIDYEWPFAENLLIAE